MQVGIFDNLQNGKTIPITQAMVQRAYRSVKKKAKVTGVSATTLAQTKRNVQDMLYILWNRLSSGSYYPPAVREVLIPKQSGKGLRPLGISTESDKVGQMVIKQLIEPRFEVQFLSSSYGYRPGKSAHEAIKAVRNNCFAYGWVVDLDIKSCFEEIDHELLLRALTTQVKEKWIRMYIRRWLEAPIQGVDGKLRKREGKGTPQGGIISPLLANIYLHYSLDKWLRLHYPQLKFVRYADDIILHCRSEEEAKTVLQAVRARLSECKLRLNEEKTRIVYCKDYKRKENYAVKKFDFLGYSFCPREIYTPSQGRSLGFVPAISSTSKRKIGGALRTMKVLKNTELRLEEIAEALNEKLRGWLNYYGLYRKYLLKRVFKRLDCRLMRWLKKKYKRLKGRSRKAWGMLRSIYKQRPHLFEHWRQGQSIVCH